MSAVLTTFAITPSVGDHIVRKMFGLSFDLDTVWATGVAVVMVCALALYLRRRLTSGVPGKLQTVWELGFTLVNEQVESTIGPAGRAIVPLALSLFVFILFCNFFEFVGIGSHYEWLPAPTGDINLPLAMALFVIVLVHVSSLRARGIVGYVRHYVAGPFPIFLLPFNLFINVLEEIAKPLTLTLRLFGNLLSGALMLSLIAYMGVQWKIGAVPVGNVLVIPVEAVWKAFALFIGLIQAFIFALLTILYFDAAMSSEH
jgi:F-type H+-transporting ATPase subunit a